MIQGLLIFISVGVIIQVFLTCWIGTILHNMIQGLYRGAIITDLAFNPDSLEPPDFNRISSDTRR